MNNYRISVIVPVYKVEKYLDRCIRSIVGQTYQELEIILVDDGSLDNCPRMCDEWAEKDRRIKVIHKENGGLSSARNIGLDMAEGDYIAFVDSDDYIKPNMYEIMLRSAIETDADIACCGRIRISEKKQFDCFVLDEPTIFSGKEAIQQLLTGGCIDEASWDKLYKKELFDKRRFPLGEINEDLVPVVKILGECKKIVHVGKPYYYYCENWGSITKSQYSPKLQIVLKHLDEVEKYISESYEMLLSEFKVLEARYCLSALYLLLNDIETYKKYKSNYEMFYLRFKQSFGKWVRCRRISKLELIKGYLIYYKIYLWLHTIKKRI